MQRVILNSLAVGNSVSACNLISSVSAPRSKLIPFLITSSWPESVRSGSLDSSTVLTPALASCMSLGLNQ